MEKTNHSVQNQKDINYYAAIRKYLQKQYPKMDKTGVSALCREAVFAPGGYAVEIDGANAPIPPYAKISPTLLNAITPTKISFLIRLTRNSPT